MKIGVWGTNHEIANMVASYMDDGVVASGNTAICSSTCNHAVLGDGVTHTHIGYGILRGMDKVFRDCDKFGFHWFNIDRGYFNPGHFDGYYRISYKGTQAKWHENAPRKEFDARLEPLVSNNGPIMICPPTAPVCNFFDIDPKNWIQNAIEQTEKLNRPFFLRVKNSISSLDDALTDCSMVITFNSSVGWEAIRRGIPCLSDPTHSVVGSYYGESLIENLLEKFYSLPREELFYFMRAHGFTLPEIAEGKAWGLIQHYLNLQSSSDGTHANLSAPMLPSTASGDEPAGN